MRALTFLRRFESFSKPAVFSCDDGLRHVAKGRQIGRAVVNDQVVGRLARLLAVATPACSLVDVPAELIQMEPQIAHFPAGSAHGCLWVEDMTDRLTLEYATQPENRPRMAGIAVLYSWAGVWQDHQIIYGKTPPHLAYSVDHGHFFRGGPDWTSQTLQAAPAAVLDPFFAQCNLTPDELRPFRAALGAVTDDHIAVVVATPPDDWGVNLEERVEMAEYLARRRAALLAVLPE